MKNVHCSNLQKACIDIAWSHSVLPNSQRTEPAASHCPFPVRLTLGPFAKRFLWMQCFSSIEHYTVCSSLTVKCPSKDHFTPPCFSSLSLIVLYCPCSFSKLLEIEHVCTHMLCVPRRMQGECTLWQHLPRALLQLQIHASTWNYWAFINILIDRYFPNICFIRLPVILEDL